jgi:hypothetical protein
MKHPFLLKRHHYRLFPLPGFPFSGRAETKYEKKQGKYIPYYKSFILICGDFSRHFRCEVVIQRKCPKPANNRKPKPSLPGLRGITGARICPDTRRPR